jgi:hypothetical protein
MFAACTHRGLRREKESIMAVKLATPPMPGGGKPAGVTTLTNRESETQTKSGNERIRILAYLKWEAAGKPNCDGLCYWLEAEREIAQT